MEEFVTKIFEIMVEILPANWEKMILHIALSPGVQSMYFFTRMEKQTKYYSYYDLQQNGIFSKEEYKNIRLKIGKESFLFQKNWKEPWTGYTLVIQRDGKVNIHYEFEEQPLGISEEWKKQYLI